MNQNNRASETEEIDLLALLRAYLHRWWLIVLAVVLLAAAAFGYTKFFVEDTYRASSTIYVNNTKEGTQVDSVSSTNLSASQQLVSTYINIVKSDRVLEKVSEYLNDSYSVEQLKKMVTATQVDETEIFAIYVTSTDPEQAAIVTNAFAQIVPNEIADVIEGSSAKVIDYAKVPTERYSPSYSKNMMVGGLIGAVIVLVILTIVYLTDVRIKDEKDLEDLFDLPILGQIPEFDSSAASSTKRAKKSKYVNSYDSSINSEKKGGK